MKNYQEKEILDLIRQRQYVSVEELAEKFYLSPSSIRRKLSRLEKEGEVTRTHGGVKIREENVFLSTFSYRTHQNVMQKKKIAQLATKLIKDGDLIFLDASTSVFFIAEYLGKFKNIRVVTNGVDTLSMLTKCGIHAYCTGGVVEENDHSILEGELTLRILSNFHADVMFFSAGSVDRKGEISDSFENENYVIQCMMEHAEKKVFLCDDTKIGKTSRYRLCSLSDVDYIVTNRDISKELECPERYKEKIIFE